MVEAGPPLFYEDGTPVPGGEAGEGADVVLFDRFAFRTVLDVATRGRLAARVAHRQLLAAYHAGRAGGARSFASYTLASIHARVNEPLNSYAEDQASGTGVACSAFS